MNRRQSCKSCPQVINRLRVDGDAGDNMCYFVLCFTEQCGLFAFMSQSWGPLFLCYTKANWCCWSLDTGPTPAIPQQLKLLGQARISWNLDLLPGRVSKEERRTWDLSNLFFFFPLLMFYFSLGEVLNFYSTLLLQVPLKLLRFFSWLPESSREGEASGRAKAFEVWWAILFLLAAQYMVTIFRFGHGTGAATALASPNYCRKQYIKKYTYIKN